MKDRLLKLINHLGYTATKFADEIGVQRSGISHILSGRNQPGYDFIVKTLNKYPAINAEWLILGKGNMHKTQGQEIQTATINKAAPFKANLQPDLFSLPADPVTSQKQMDSFSNIVTNVTIVQRVLILNSDGTFNLYNAAGKD